MSEAPIEDFTIPPDEPKPKKEYHYFIVIPIMILLSIFVWLTTHDPFWTSVFAVVMTYGTLMLIPALRGDYSTFIRPLPPPIPKDVNVPDEYEGRPDLFLAYLVRNANEDNELRKVIEARGPGGNPDDKINGWDRL